MTRARAAIYYIWSAKFLTFRFLFLSALFLFYLILYCFSLFSSFISVGCEVNLGRQASRPNTRACSCGLVSPVHCSFLPIIIFEWLYCAIATTSVLRDYHKLTDLPISAVVVECRFLFARAMWPLPPSVTLHSEGNFTTGRAIKVVPYLLRRYPRIDTDHDLWRTRNIAGCISRWR